MKLSYIVATVILLLGMCLLVFGVSDGEHVSVFGMSLHTRIAKGVGIVSIILGIIAFMVAYGGSLPSSRVERSR
jgi:hypothetical protein